MIYEDHAHAFVDENNNVINMAMFSSHDEELLQTISTNFNAYAQYCVLEITNGEFCGTSGKIIDGAYIEPPVVQPASWVLNKRTGQYEPPIPRPDSGFWVWNEAELKWDETSIY